MEPALKQRLVGAVVLVALAVIFLPMLIEGPAPESGAADVSLDVPAAPGDVFETRELPLVAPGAAPSEGVVGLDARDERDDGDLPTVDTADVAPADSDGDGILEGPLAADLADPADATRPEEPAPEARDTADNRVSEATPAEMTPAPVAGGDWAVSFGTFSTRAAADRVVAQLRASQLPGFREQATVDGRQVHRVRIGPYDSEATAQAARLRAAHVRDDVGARVIALDAARDAPVAAAPAAADDEQPAPAPAPAQTPTSGTGFVVQLGAFSKQGDVDALVARARAAGFNVSTQPVETDGGRLTRVLVGPAFDRAAADALKARAQSRLGIDGLVRSYP
ncbi:SPOR domain-containing protein [Luteimonas pelagia]